MYVYVMMNPSVNSRPDKTEAAFKALVKLKAEKTKGTVTLHLDGSGVVARVEIKQDI